VYTKSQPKSQKSDVSRPRFDATAAKTEVLAPYNHRARRADQHGAVTMSAWLFVCLAGRPLFPISGE
jgi:hypothetical protein